LLETFPRACADFVSFSTDSISLTFYSILLKHATFLQAGSMDEVLMSVTVPPTITRSTSPAVALAEQIRSEILTATGCHASVGISHNILLAKLATRRAKPAGSFQLLPEDIPSLLPPLSVDSLPGIGWATRDKLHELGVKTVADLQKVDKFRLTKCIGQGNAVKFAGFAKGIDESELEGEKARMSISAEVNYGIRFSEGEAGKEQVDVRSFPLSLHFSRADDSVRPSAFLATTC
jgi:DNA repair protein REV1